MNCSLYFNQIASHFQKSRHPRFLLTISAGSLILLGGMSQAGMAQVPAATERSQSTPKARITLTGDAVQHPFFFQTVTMPSTGCPCYLRVEGQLVISGPLQDAFDSPSFNLNASDGTTSFNLLHEEPVHLTIATPQSGISADDITVPPIIIGTSYANNQKVTLTMFYRAVGLSTGPVTLERSVKDPAVTNSLYKSYFLVSAGPVLAPSPTVPVFTSGTFE